MKKITPRMQYSHQYMLVFILLLGFILRIVGITWGINIENSHQSFHPDEEFAVQVLKDLHPESLDFNPESGHMEGTFYYYVVAAFSFILSAFYKLLQLLGISLLPSLTQYTAVILVGRMISVIAGTSGIFLLYKLVKMAKMPTSAALLAALVLAVFPIDVIYSHFFRPHIFANFLLLLALVFYFSKDTLKTDLRIALVGFFLGLAIAARYNLAIALLIPGLLLFFELIEKKPTLKEILLHRPFYLLGIFTFVGFFLGDPYLFLAYNQAKPYLDQQRSFVEPGAFSPNNLANIGNPLKYLTYLIPEAGKPFFYVPIFTSFIIAFINKKRLTLALSLMLFCISYIYFMGKGYSQPVFARAVIPLMPIFAILIAVSYENFKTQIKNISAAYIFLAITILSSLGSIYFLGNYYYAITTTIDPRYQLNNVIIQSQITKITIENDYLCKYYINSIIQESDAIITTVDSREINHLLETTRNQPLVLCSTDQPSDQRIQELLKNIPIDKITLIDRTDSRSLTIEIPHDMMYPFTRFYIIKN